MKLAVILTCFNRKEKTINCVKKLIPQLERGSEEYRFYICDDQSTDGTFESLKELLPGHEVFQSTGNFYWSKGMYHAMKKAVEDKNDYYLMVNDDVDFFENALDIMFHSYKEAGKSCGIVGSTASREDGSITYGGRRNQDSVNPLIPQEELQECFYTNWNCFLIDKHVMEIVGCIDAKYQHGFGDYDYSQRMNKKGISVYVANGVIGYCEKNSIKGTYRDTLLTRKQRFQKLFSPKGVPVYSYFRYHIKNEGLGKIPACIYGYMMYLIEIVFQKTA